MLVMVLQYQEGQLIKMNNILLKVNKDINLYHDETNSFMGYILGVDTYSICCGINYSVNKIKEIRINKFIEKEKLLSQEIYEEKKARDFLINFQQWGA